MIKRVGTRALANADLPCLHITAGASSDVGNKTVCTLLLLDGSVSCMGPVRIVLRNLSKFAPLAK